MSIEPFTIVLGARGGNPECDYDYEFDSGGRGTLKLFSSDRHLVPSLFRQSRTQIVETKLDPEAIERVAKVLETSLLRNLEGVYGGQFGARNSSRFHYARRSIDVITPIGRRRVEFPRIYAWREFQPQDQEFLLGFLDLWAAVEPTIPDERLRTFTSEWMAVTHPTKRVADPATSR